jgi:hypothetical protein
MSDINLQRKSSKAAFEKKKFRGSVHAAESPVYKEGYLQKKSSGGGIGPKRFQRRFFRIQGNYLKYTESENSEEGKVKGVVDLRDVKEVNIKGNAGEIMVDMKPAADGEKGPSPLSLKAADLADAQEWLEALEMALTNAAMQARAETEEGSTRANTYSDGVDAADVAAADPNDPNPPARSTFDEPPSRSTFDEPPSRSTFDEPAPAAVPEPVVAVDPEDEPSPTIEPVSVTAVTVEIKKMQLDKLVRKATASIQSALKLESQVNRADFLESANPIIDRFQELRSEFLAPLQILMQKGHNVPMDQFDRTLSQILGPCVINPELAVDTRQRKELQEAMALYYKNIKEWDKCTDKKAKMLMQEDYLVWQERLLDHSKQEVLLVNTMQFSPFETEEEVEKYLKEPGATLVSVAKMFLDERGLLIKDVTVANDNFEASLAELEMLEPAAEPPTDPEDAEGVLKPLDDMQQMNESSRRALLLWQLTQQAEELMKQVQELMLKERETQQSRESRTSAPFAEWARAMKKLRETLQDAIDKAQRHFELMTEDLEDRVRAAEKRSEKLAQMETVSLELGVGQQMAKDQQEIKELQSDVAVLKAKVEALQERRDQLLTKLKPLLKEVCMINEPQAGMHEPMAESKFEDWLQQLMGKA